MKVGLDVGYYQTKVIAPGRRACFPSVVGLYDQGFSLNGPADDIILQKGDFRWAVGDLAAESRIQIRQENRTWWRSNEYDLLVTAALSTTTEATRCEFDVVTGLPVAYFELDKDELRDELQKPRQARRTGRHIQQLSIRHVRVIPQGLASYLDYCLDAHGKAKLDRATKSVGILDIGGHTTNVFSVRRLTEIPKETTSIDFGAWDAVRAIRPRFEASFPDLGLTDHEVAEAITTRQVTYFGEKHKVCDIVNEVLSPMADQIIAQAQQLWGQGAGLDLVYVTGGGTLLFDKLITRRFQHTVVSRSPVFGGAIGCWKLAQRFGP